MPVEDYPCAKAPPVTASVYDESMPMLFASRMVYAFTDLLSMAMRERIQLKIPEEFKVKNLERFLEESVDLTEFEDGNGLTFYAVLKLLDANEDALKLAFPEQSYERKVVGWFRDNSVLPDGTDLTKMCYLTYHRSLQSGVACVYSIFKDSFNKRIIVSFRGSSGFFITTRDWQTNLNARVVEMWTPPLIADEMEGKLKNRVLVHKGFYEYLFNNHRMKYDQRYDGIIEDIKAVNEDGYGVYVTGHSLGGALATLFSFKIAGSGKKRDWLPRPVTCISFAAPFSGTAGYRTATELLERRGLLRSIRITNGEDLVPAIPNWSLFPMRPMKQVGMNLRLTSSGYRIEHSSLANWWTSFRNSILKPIWLAFRWHGLPLHDVRMEENEEELKNVILDDLYKDEKYVSRNFINGNLL